MRPPPPDLVVVLALILFALACIGAVFLGVGLVLLAAHFGPRAWRGMRPAALRAVCFVWFRGHLWHLFPHEDGRTTCMVCGAVRRRWWRR